jgi:putative NADPH-quinone reductase
MSVPNKKILVICGHPNPDTLTGTMADHYQAGAEDAGHEVRRINIGELNFDPVLHKGYKEIQELEPDLISLQDSFRWADHVVVVYPNWWCSMPAKLKGLFDRFWLPGFAFNFNKTTKRVDRRLKGKTARVIILSGTYGPFRMWWLFGDYTNEIQYGILEFAGIKTSVSSYGPTEKVADTKRTRWLKEVERLGQRGL